MAAQAKATEPNIVNGINVDDLFALINDVKREPAKGKTNWHVTTTWQGQARSRAEIESYEIGGKKVPRRFSIDIDEPCELGGSNSFANPQEHLIAALNAWVPAGAPKRRRFFRGGGTEARLVVLSLFVWSQRSSCL